MARSCKAGEDGRGVDRPGKAGEAGYVAERSGEARQVRRGGAGFGMVG
jgi:hypothetical protein